MFEVLPAGVSILFDEFIVFKSLFNFLFELLFTLQNLQIKRDKKNYQPRNYKTISENTLKKWYTNHKRSFNITKYKNDTKLSAKKLKTGNSNPKVTWAVKKTV